MDAIIEKLLQYPNLPTLLKELNQFIAEENIQREHYRSQVEQNGKTEFINGRTIFYPKRNYKNSSTLERLFHFLYSFVISGDEGIVIRDVPINFSRNNYQPDITFYKKEKAEAFTGDQVFLPSPDFIAEFSSSAMEESIQQIKFEEYALHNVQEYWLLNLANHSAEQYVLQNGRYELEHKSKTGIITSKLLTGFSIEVKTIFNEKESSKSSTPKSSGQTPSAP